MDKKLKVLVLSDHALSTSGVGTQTRHLLTGLIDKGHWTFRQFGAALKHSDYRTVIVNDDLIIKPIDGFGNAEMLRVALATEKPDLLFIFTDPRFFVWLFEMEDEIHQVCPIVWWHVWDNYPYPDFNDAFYEATDVLNCHSHMTYNMIKEKYPNKTNWIPHSLPDNLFFPLEKQQIKESKIQLLGEDREDHFVGIWVNRNAKRKRPNDVLNSWALFLKSLKRKKGHTKATLIMHTEPTDSEGPNLFRTSEMLGIQNNVFFSRDRLEFEKMNVLYNISDFCLNMSYAEGFGLSTLESMMTGTPIIAAKTGGLTKQVCNDIEGGENGVALNIDLKTLVGSQTVPYIYEDYVSNQSVANGIMKLYLMSDKQKNKLSRKVLRYAKKEFGHQKTVDLWDKTMLQSLESFQKKKESYTVTVF
jgi:glycosyltransferase involved in cell wall biosynthesis